MSKHQYMIIGGELYHADAKPIKRYGIGYKDSAVTKKVTNGMPGEYIGMTPTKGSYPSRLMYKNVQYQLARYDNRSYITDFVNGTSIISSGKVGVYVNANNRSIYVALIDKTDLYRIDG